MSYLILLCFFALKIINLKNIEVLGSSFDVVETPSCFILFSGFTNCFILSETHQLGGSYSFTSFVLTALHEFYD